MSCFDGIQTLHPFRSMKIENPHHHSAAPEPHKWSAYRPFLSKRYYSFLNSRGHLTQPIFLTFLPRHYRFTFDQGKYIIFQWPWATRSDQQLRGYLGIWYYYTSVRPCKTETTYQNKDIRIATITGLTNSYVRLPNEPALESKILVVRFYFTSFLFFLFSSVVFLIPHKTRI